MSRKRSHVGTFGSHLRHFARSVDIVDNSIFVDARQLVCEYLRDQLEAVYFELALEHQVNDAPGLKTFWSSGNRDFSTGVKRPDGQYSSQLALSFGTGKPLWIVSADDRPLRSAEDYQDLWSQLAGLPRYRSPIDDDLFTSVLIPMWRPGGRRLGVMYLESSRRLDIADFDRQELTMLADALGVLLDLRQLNDLQTQGTRDAVSDLRRTKDAVVFPQIAKPQIFVAFSSRADQQVVGLLVDELDKLNDRLRILPWDRIDDTGMISTHLAQAITTSRFGVCYLSEPDGQGGYQDNPNVLFEAGMLHALSLSTQEQAAWLPIREEKSPPPPFDFAGDRIEMAPRTASQVNEQLFRARLRARLLRLTDDTP
jgi:hypothetical protein